MRAIVVTLLFAALAGLAYFLSTRDEDGGLASALPRSSTWSERREGARGP